MKMGEKIKKLKGEGKSYREICRILNTSIGNVAYHCNPVTNRKAVEARIIFRNNRKYGLKQAKIAAGGKCIKCGYSNSLNALCFHHRDPKTKYRSKDGKIRNLQYLFAFKNDLVTEEIKKCDLLCANCHIETHFPN